jgi:hypothetical protein
VFPWVVDEQDDLGSPELDVLGFQAQEIFSDLVVDQVLGDVTPVFRRAEIMNQEEEEDE